MTFRTFAIAVLTAVGAACAPRPAAHPPERTAEATQPADPAPGVVAGDTARRLVSGGARLVDVRTPQEFASGHAEGAINIPFDEMARRAGEVGPPETAVVVYCRTGRRSAIAAEALRASGFTKVYDLQRYDAWPKVAATPAPQ